MEGGTAGAATSAPGTAGTATPDGDAADAGGSDATAPGPADPAAAGTTVLVRTADHLAADGVAALARLPGVATVDAVRRDDVALFASTGADGQPVDDLPDGFKISVGVAVADAHLPAAVAPDPGEVLLTGPGARLRRLGPGGEVVLGRDRRSLRVAAVVDDPALADHELVLHPADADALGVRGRDRLVLRLQPDADPELVARGAREVIDDVERDGQVVAVRAPSALPSALPGTEVKRVFGEFAFRDLPGRDVQVGVSWSRRWIQPVTVPGLGTFRCHVRMVEPLTAVMATLRESGLADEVAIGRDGGCWTPRRIGDDANLSRHAWGAALDVNVDMTLPGGGPEPSPEVVAAFARHGFAWGGDYAFPDNHHFEWVGVPGRPVAPLACWADPACGDGQ